MTTNFIKWNERLRGQIGKVSLPQIVAVILVVWTLGTVAAASSSIEPLYGNQAGVAYTDSIAQLKPGWVVTAVCNSNEKLELIVWNDTGTALVRTGSYTATRDCSSVAITALNAKTVVTDNANGTGHAFELTAWRVSSTGSISPLGTTAAGCSDCAGIASITKLDSTQVVTSQVTAGGNLVVTAWLVPSSGDSAQAAGSFAAQSAITTLNSSQVVTVGTVGSGCSQCDLEVIAGTVDSAGNVTQQGSASAGAAESVGIARWNADTVITSLINGSGDLEVISWSVNSAGVVTRKASGTGGTVLGLIGICLIPTDKLPLTAVTTASYGLSVEVWETSGSSGLEELTTYNTSLSQVFTAAASIAPHKVVAVGLAIPGSDLQLEEFELESSSASN